MTLIQYTMPSELRRDDLLRFGEIVLVRFPFTSQLATKQRPALVISGSIYNRIRRDIIVMAVTSQMSLTVEYGHTEIVNWEKAGLLKPSVIKPIIATFEQTLILRKLGKLIGGDLSALKQLLTRITGEDDIV